LVASGTSFVGVKALVVDENTTEPVAGKTVYFYTSSGRFSSESAVTDSAGIAAVTLFSSTAIGEFSVSAESETVRSNNTITATYIAGPVYSISPPSANPLQVGPVGSSVVSCDVKDDYGHFLVGIPVSFSSNGASSGTLGTLFDPGRRILTDNDGTASVSYRAGNEDAVDTITASYDTGTVTIADTVDIKVNSTVLVGSDFTVVLSKEMIPADGFSAILITATVVDVDNKPVNAAPVLFSLSDATFGSISNGSQTTNSAGKAFATFTAGITPGVATIIVTSGYPQTFPVTLTAGQAASLALSANPATITINGQAQLEAIVLDTNGNPVPEESVEFSRAFGGSGIPDADQMVTTNARGIAKLIYTAGVTPAIDTFTAALTNVANVVATVIVTVDPDDTQIATINIVEVLPGDLLSTGTTATIKVEALGTGNVPLEGVTLAGFGTGSADVVGPSPALTDVFGRTSFTVTDAFEETVEVRITGGKIVAKQVLNFGPPIDLTLAATPQQVIADGVSTVSITATVVGADNDIPVSFSLTDPSLGALNQTTVNTVAGIATTTFTAGTVAGAVTILAEASGFAKTITVTLVPSPATTLVFNAAHNPLLAANTTQLIATITDDNGNGIQGETVVFTLDSDGSGTSFTSGTATTDGRGIAKLDYTAGSLPGTDSFTADPDNPGVNSASLDVTVEGDKADITSIVIDQVDPGTLLTATGSADVTVTVSGADGPLEELTLNAAVTGGATVTPDVPVTDQFGQATVTITGTVAENVLLRISGGSKAAQRTFTFGPTLSLTPSVVSALGETTLTAVLRDINGVPLPGVDINFISTYAVAADNDNIVTSVSGPTDASGIVTATVVDTDGNAGAVSITAKDRNEQISSAPSAITFQTEADTFDLVAEVSLPVVILGGTSTITATVTNSADGSPAAGQNVDFIATDGVFAATSSCATVSGTTASCTTASNGEVSVTLQDDASDAGTVVVTISSGLNEVEIPVYFDAGIQLNPINSEGVANGTFTAPLTATVFDADNIVITGIPVHFAVTGASPALLSAGEDLTNDLGDAGVTVTNSVIEPATIQASAGNLDPVTSYIEFFAGGPANLALTSSFDNAIALSLLGQATITADVTDILGNEVTDNTPVTFSVSGTATSAEITSEATTIGGEVTVSLSAGDVSGSLTVTVTAGTVSKTLTFTVAPSEAGTIEVVRVEPSSVQMQGQPGTQSATITFLVKDPGGNSVEDGTAVTISMDINQLAGGELISDGLNPYGTTFDTTTVAGVVTALFRSGIVSGPVDIIATVAAAATDMSATDISTVAIVTVVGGQADSLHQFTSGSPLNIPSQIYDGCTATLNYTLGDRYGNPVIEGTNVSFMVEPGCTLIGGSDQWFTDKNGRVSIVDFAFGSGDFNFLPVAEGPECTVVAYASGDEGFADNNGNGIWDAGEACVGDLGEPYVDANDNGSYDLGEDYIDGAAGNVGKYDAANGNCETNTLVWKRFDYLSSGNITTFAVDDPGFFSLGLGESKPFDVTINDDNLAPPISGTSLTTTADNGTVLGGNKVMADTSFATPMTSSFTLTSDQTGEPILTTVSLSLDAPDGGGFCNDNGFDNLTLQFFGLINVPAPVIPDPVVVDGDGPTVTFTVPEDGGTLVGTKTSNGGILALIFNENLDPVTVNAATIHVSGDGGIDPLTAGYYNVTPSMDGNVLLLKMDEGSPTFKDGENVIVTITDQVRDLAGNTLDCGVVNCNVDDDYEFNFTVFDPTHQ
jgi:adhesin/invasin